MSKRTIIITILIITIILGTANVIAASAVATTGPKLQDLQNQAIMFEEHNQSLARSIASLTSLSSLETRAQKLNFTNQPGIVTLATPAPVALLR